MFYRFLYNKNIFIYLVKSTLYYITTSLLGRGEDLIILEEKYNEIYFLGLCKYQSKKLQKLKFNI